MKQFKIFTILLAITVFIASCGSLNYTGKGALIGTGSGAAVGSLVGGLIGKGKGAAIGAAVGGAVGAGAGAAIGHRMDKKAEQAAQIEGAEVEKVTDVNGLTAVKVTFNSAILFDFNSSTLSSKSKTSLAEFAKILKEDPDIDIAVFGHTDKIGTYEANQKVQMTVPFPYRNTCSNVVYHHRNSKK